jgi:hypothetical protein
MFILFSPNPSLAVSGGGKTGDDRPVVLQMTRIQTNSRDYFTSKTKWTTPIHDRRSHRFIAVAIRQPFPIGVTWFSALADAGGSPFQLPARLADGWALKVA